MHQGIYAMSRTQPNLNRSRLIQAVSNPYRSFPRSGAPSNETNPCISKKRSFCELCPLPCSLCRLGGGGGDRVMIMVTCRPAISGVVMFRPCLVSASSRFSALTWRSAGRTHCRAYAHHPVHVATRASRRDYSYGIFLAVQHANITVSLTCYLKHGADLDLHLS
jgi:hypothetical protein